MFFSDFFVCAVLSLLSPADIDECAQTPRICDTQILRSQCVNTLGSYKCVCNEYRELKGESCERTYFSYHLLFSLTFFLLFFLDGLEMHSFSLTLVLRTSRKQSKSHTHVPLFFLFFIHPPSHLLKGLCTQVFPSFSISTFLGSITAIGVFSYLFPVYFYLP